MSQNTNTEDTIDLKELFFSLIAQWKLIALCVILSLVCALLYLRTTPDTYAVNALVQVEESKGASQPLLPEFKDDEDQEFARRLFRRTILNGDYYRHLISDNTRNWDLDRVAFMDVVIMQCALAEILSFPNIPISVSLNEYVEIAKLYSTAKSGSFINGTLDGIVNQLKKEGKLTK